MLQYAKAWHLEQIYEFTMKLRLNKVLLDKFINEFEKYHFEKNDIKKKQNWLIDFIMKSEYVSAFFCLKIHIASHNSCLLL